HVARGVERDAPRTVGRGRALVARRTRRLRRELERARWQTFHLVLAGERQRERFRRVEDVVAEARRALGELGLDCVEALLLLALEPDAGELRVAHQRLDDALLGRVERLPARAVAQLLQRAVHRTALADAQRERDHL